MQWDQIRAAYPDQWLVIEALEAHTDRHHRMFDQIVVVEACASGASAMKRYRELRHEHPERELCFVHTANAVLEIVERSWVGIRRNDDAHSSR